MRILLEMCGSRGAELPLAGVDVVVVERRTNHEVDGSRAGGLPSRVVATRPGLAQSPGSCGKRSAARTRSERGPTG
jgi:hypothetical protein